MATGRPRRYATAAPAAALEAQEAPTGWPTGAGISALDTNLLARFYVDDPSDPEAQHQRPVARRVLLESPALFVPLTVVLEFEWVMRGCYEQPPAAFCAAIDHLLGLPHVTVEHWQQVHDALAQHRQGLDFADALHLALSAHCARLLTFDDRRFARRAQRLQLAPAVQLAGEVFPAD